MLRAKGVITTSAELRDLLDSGSGLPAGPHERALRAAAVVACKRLASALAATGSGQAAAEPTPAPTGGEGGAEASGRGEGGTEGIAAADAGTEIGRRLTAAEVGAYLCSLAEEGRPLFGKVHPHRTLGVMAY